LCWDFPFLVDVVDMVYAIICDVPTLDVEAPEYMVAGFNGGVAFGEAVLSMQTSVLAMGSHSYTNLSR
jgi:hypothetical protein